MTMLNPFSESVKLVDYTSTINALPNYYDSITKLNLFKPDRVASQIYTIDVQENPYALVPTQEWGQDNYSLGVNSKRKVREIQIPHTCIIEEFLVTGNSGMREFGTADQYMAVAKDVERKLQELKNRIDLTREYRYISALKGKVLDADGVKELFNPYNFFKTTKKVLEIKLSDASYDVAAKCLELKRHMETHAFGETFSSIHVLVSPDFFDAFVRHPKVKEAYMYQSEASNRLGYDIQKNFKFQGIVFEEYNANVIDTKGKEVPFLPGVTGVAFPLGTHKTFIEAIAPAAKNATNSFVNTKAQTYYYSWSAPIKPWDTGYQLTVESNTLPLVLRPMLIVEVKAI